MLPGSLMIALMIVFAPLAIGCAQEQAKQVQDTQEQVKTVSDADKVSLWTRDGLDWPGFLGSKRDGTSEESGFRFDWSADPPSRVWDLRIGEGYGIGAISGGRYFHFDRHRDNARIRAVNVETGKLLWEFTYPTDYKDTYGFDGGPRGSPVVDEDRVYIFGVEGMLHCLNAYSGEQIWDIDTAERFGVIQNFFGVGSTPLIHEDKLIVMIGGSPPESQEIQSGRLGEVKPNGNAIIAFNKLTGEVIYETIDDLASYASPTIGEIDGQQVGLAFCRTSLFGFDPQTGAVQFEFPYRARKYESVNAATPLTIDSNVLLTESYALGGALLKVETPQQDKEDWSINPVWQDEGTRDPSLACHWNTPVVVGDYVYACSGESKANATVNCVRLSDGKLMWSEPGLTRSSLTLVQDHLLCMTEEGRLLVIRPDSEKFDLVAEYPADQLSFVSPCWAAPIVAHGFVIVRGRAKVICLDA